MADLYIVKGFLDCDSRFGVTSFISDSYESCYTYIKGAIANSGKPWDYYSLYEAGIDQQDAQSITYINQIESPIDSWRKESV